MKPAGHWLFDDQEIRKISANGEGPTVERNLLVPLGVFDFEISGSGRHFRFWVGIALEDYSTGNGGNCQTVLV
jgi:hypothetical protein